MCSQIARTVTDKVTSTRVLQTTGCKSLWLIKRMTDADKPVSFYYTVDLFSAPPPTRVEISRHGSQFMISQLEKATTNMRLVVLLKTFSICGA